MEQNAHSKIQQFLGHEYLSLECKKSPKIALSLLGRFVGFVTTNLFNFTKITGTKTFQQILTYQFEDFKKYFIKLLEIRC
jgi:hypothetical protein